MEGTIYADGTLVDAAALGRTESTKAGQILADRVNNLELGIRTGLKLTVNPVNQQRVDLTAGDGYAPNGERVVVPVIALPNVGALNIPIADPALGAINYCYVFYNEVKAGPMPHETNGTTPDTQAVAGFVIQVLTSAQFNALPLTDPTYQQQAQDRAMLLGIITGTGGALLPSSIEQPVEWRTLKYATIPAPGISGVTIIAVSDTSPVGDNGTLFYDATGPLTLAWQAPGEAGPGPTVIITAEDDYTLTALGGTTITVHVVPAALPVASTSTQVIVSGVYDQAVPRESPADYHHRSKVGTGVVTPQNPHGLSLDDISPGFEDELRNHQRFAHANGLYRGSSLGLLAGTIIEVATPDSFQVNPPAGSDAFYVDGKRLVAVANTAVIWTDAIPGPTKELYEIAVDSAGNVFKSKLASWQNAVPAIDGVENNIVFMTGVPAGVHTLTYTSNGPGLGGTLQWDGGNPTPVTGPVPAQVFRIRNGAQEVAFFFGQPAIINALAAGVYSDNINVNPSVDVLTSLVTAQLPWTGSATGGLGFTANRGIVAARYFDLRRFGTIEDFHIGDRTLRAAEAALADHSPDGVVVGAIDAFVGSLLPSAGAGLTVDINGSAPVYVKGRRFLVTGAPVPVANNDVTLIYVDQNGVIQQVSLLVVTPSFLTDPKQSGWAGSDENVRWGAAIAIATTSGGVVTDLVDMRRNLSGGNVTIAPYSVGGIGVGLIAEAVEFFDLTAAFIYAIAASSPGQAVPPLTVVDAVLRRPFTPAAGASLVVRGGNLWLSGTALSQGAFTLTQVKLDLEGVVFRGDAGLVAPVATSALVTLGAGARVSWRGGGVTSSAGMTGMSALVRVTSATAEVDLDDLVTDQSAPAVTAAIVYATANPASLDIRNIFLRAGGAQAFITADDVTVGPYRVSGCNNDVGLACPIYRLIGAGVVDGGTYTGCTNLGAPAGALNPSKIDVTGSTLDSATWTLTESSFTGCYFDAGHVFENCSGVKVTSSQTSAFTLDSCSRMSFTGIAALSLLTVRDVFDSSFTDFTAAVLNFQGLCTNLVFRHGTLSDVAGITYALLSVLTKIVFEDVTVTDTNLSTTSFTDLGFFRCRFLGQLRAIANASSKGLRVDSCYFPRTTPGTSILLNDITQVDVTRCLFTAPSCRQGVIQFGPFAGSINISDNRFLIRDGEDETYGVGLANWGVPVIWGIDVAAPAFSTRSDGFRCEGNEFVSMNVNDAPVPMIAVMLQVDRDVGTPSQNRWKNFRVDRNVMRYNDYSFGMTAYTWMTLNGVLIPSYHRLALLTVVDLHPGGWVSPAGHGRNVQWASTCFNRIVAFGAATDWIIALAYDLANPFTDTSYKVAFNGGAGAGIDAPGALTLGGTNL